MSEEVPAAEDLHLQDPPQLHQDLLHYHLLEDHPLENQSNCRPLEDRLPQAVPHFGSRRHGCTAINFTDTGYLRMSTSLFAQVPVCFSP